MFVRADIELRKRCAWTWDKDEKCFYRENKTCSKAVCMFCLVAWEAATGRCSTLLLAQGAAGMARSPSADRQLPSRTMSCSCDSRGLARGQGTGREQGSDLALRDQRVVDRDMVIRASPGRAHTDQLFSKVCPSWFQVLLHPTSLLYPSPPLPRKQGSLK